MSIRPNKPGFISACLLALQMCVHAQAAGPVELAPTRIDLATTLRLAGADNLDVRLARAKLDEAKALDESATWQFLPWLSPGVSYRAHDNLIQNVEGRLIDVHRDATAFGPSLLLQLDVGEALYRKLAAQQTAKAAGFGAEARLQETLLSAVNAYFDCAQAQASLALVRENIAVTTDYLGQLERAAQAGLAFRGDVLRLQAQLERQRHDLVSAEEQQSLARTKLGQILRIGPQTKLLANEDDLTPMTLVQTNASLAGLISQARARRPEIHESSAAVQAAVEARKGARYGPLFPTVGAQVVVGGMAGGNDQFRNHGSESEDYQVTVSWRIGPGGIGDRSRSRLADARLRMAESGDDKVQDEISRQVADALVRAISAGEKVAHLKSAAASATEAFKLARSRREFGVGIVAETILAEQEQTKLRLELLNAVSQHNKAQYSLLRATGNLGPVDVKMAR